MGFPIVDNLQQLLAFAGSEYRGRICTEDPRPIGFEELLPMASQVGRLLGERGVGPGARVATVLHNGPSMLWLFLGVMASGRTLVPINPKLGRRELLHIAEDSGAELVFFDPLVGDLVGDCFKNARLVPVHADAAWLAEIFAPAPRTPLLPEIRPTDVAEIVYTSGSTGVPKGVSLTHQNLLANSRELATEFELSSQDRLLTFCPMFHNSGQIFTTLGALWSGAVNVIVRPELGMLKFWSLVQEHRISWSFVMNAVLHRMLQSNAPARSTPLKGLLAGGSKLPAAALLRFEERFGVPVYQVYGLTETTSIATCERPRLGASERGSVGQALGCCSIKVVPGPGGGRLGQIYIRGANVCSGYHARPDLNAERFSDGWLKTGDLGYISELGNLFVEDREDDLIIVGGENIYPSEIENQKAALEGVAELMVVDVEHPILDREIVLVYRRDSDGGDANAALIDTWRRKLAAELARFKVPTQYVSVAALGWQDFPRTETGKLLRSQVKSRVREMFAGRGPT